MADDNDTAKAAIPAKSKKKIWLWIFIVVILLGASVGADWYFTGRPDDGGASEEEAQANPAPAPVYLPLDPLVINLSDEGGGRFAQVGITLQVRNADRVEDIRKLLPTIRNGILMLISERTSQDMLSKEGKERLAEDILEEVGIAFGIEPAQAEVVTEPETVVATETEKGKPAKPKKRSVPKVKPVVPLNPVISVLFSSMVVQ